MSDEHSFTLHRAATEYRELGSKLRELARASVFPGPRRSLSRLAAAFDRRAAHFRYQSHGTRSPVIGETPEWMLWAVVGLLIVVMLTPALKR
jgi:hypothetical protein